MSEDRYRSDSVEDRAADIQQHLAESSEKVLEKELTELIGSESDSDETLELIEAYLVELEKRTSFDPEISAEESLQNFHKKYAPIFKTAPVHEPEQKRKRSIPRGRLIAIAAVIAVAVSMFAMQASGGDIITAISRWTGEAFQMLFSGGAVPAEDSPGRNEELAELQAGLDYHGITAELVPKYLPEGYTQVEGFVQEDGSFFVAVYQCEDDYITIQISKIEDGAGYKISKDPGDPEIYTIHGVDHSIMTNAGTYTAAWENAGYECLIMNVCSEDVIYRMLDSIYQ